jgi:BirA family biotin operon repressor/biotin-[acetyl-CoA-carboxylase] ligase
MTRLDADAIRENLGEFAASRLDRFESFDEIGSTNTHLMQQPAPSPGRLSVAITDNQVAGRGRHGRTWQSPPGSGICLSLGYTFDRQPRNLSALTLAIGLGVVDALDDAGAPGILLKWPNDLIANDGKLGGILTEAQSLGQGAAMVVTGIGLNVDLQETPGAATGIGDARPIADLAGLGVPLAPRHEIAARLIERVCGAFVAYEDSGFVPLAARWSERDWLRGRQLTVDTPRRRVAGVGAGIADDGALLVDTGAGTRIRVTSGSIVVVEPGAGGP